MRVALITGGLGGFGLGLAKRLIKDNDQWHVALVDLLPEHLFKEKCESLPLDRVTYVRCNVSTELENAFNAVLDKWKRLDLVVNNAGITELGDIVHGSKFDDEWRTVVDINLTALIHGTKLAMVQMIEQRQMGDNQDLSIINTSSLSGLYPLPIAPVYTATKYGVVGLTLALEKRLKSHNIRINCICPSFADTNLVRKGLETGGEVMAQLVKEGQVPVDLVLDGFMLLVKSTQISGESVRVTPQYGIDLARTRVTGTKKSKL